MHTFIFLQPFFKLKLTRGMNSYTIFHTKLVADHVCKLTHKYNLNLHKQESTSGGKSICLLLKKHETIIIKIA